jgi:hypothetical protein
MRPHPMRKWDVRRGPGSATATGWQRCSDISDSKITSGGNPDADDAQAFVVVAPSLVDKI